MRIKWMVKRVVSELLHDKRTLALMLLAPMLILTLLYFLFHGVDSQNQHVGFCQNNELTRELSKLDVDIDVYSCDRMEETLKDHDLDALISFDQTDMKVLYQNSDPTITKQVKQKLMTAQMRMKLDIQDKLIQKQSAGLQGYVKEQPDNVIVLHEDYLYGNEHTEYFDKLYPVLIGFFVFFFVFLISGISLLKERTSGTLTRLLATPIKRSEIILGYMLGYGIFAIIQTILIVLFSVYVLQMNVAGNLGMVMGTNILLAGIALSMGIFISTFAHSEFQMMQFIPIVVIPQVFFSGILNVDAMANWMQVIARMMPMYYGGNTLYRVMYQGVDAISQAPNLVIMGLFIILFTILNIVGLKRYRKV